jgi:ribosomal protein L11 methyltransferase
MPLIELELRLPGERIDEWSDALVSAGALSVTIEDEDAGTPDEVGAYAEPGLPPARAGWRNNRVTVLLEERADLDAWLRGAAAALGCAPPLVLACRPLEDQDWVRQTQAQFGPIQVGRIAVVPTWHEPPAGASCVLRIDPGTAFGTGAHPTTRLCLAWLDQHLEAGASVLDFGCGSGILSICAALLGAGRVRGVDIDAQAVAAARDNARRNHAAALYTSPEEFARDPNDRFDLVVANILANPLIVLAPALARRVRDAGQLLLSGILERQVEGVIAAYRKADPSLRLRAWGQDEGWVAIAGRREK